MTANILMTIRDISKVYGQHIVLKNVDLDVYHHEFLALVGKSGGGKSTLLRLIAGLEQPNNGEIKQSDRLIEKTNDKARMMFQEDRLLPWMSVLDNITFASKNTQAQKEAKNLLDLVGLTEYADVYPTKLSGGQKQRLALARALFAHPDLLLLDEPLGALDALTRRNMQDLIIKVCQKKQITTILVTHDINEAVRMANRIVLIKDQGIKEVFENPYQGINTTEAKEKRALIADDILEKILN
ncbi:ABC transporter ATP-binding protein [Liquorilactobacillus vini]|uniref:ABC transporter ATP-binding protein n=1 Tax=Liquorilactobacillus vini DSM 20605 TaxID=1133569 RepID=A0A0R2CC91_9LACO|nr:ABC transporter ATP-binding protein [Liquorilactobacillus vini]KRM88722.1 ABC transporter ATP-binding protein [Liquorilactobacillus vini DSM 20605]